MKQIGYGTYYDNNIIYFISCLLADGQVSLCSLNPVRLGGDLILSILMMFKKELGNDSPKHVMLCCSQLKICHAHVIFTHVCT
jgi:hypothetical protein